MNKLLNKYKIEETRCYPNSYKIIHVGYKDDNSTSNFFPTRKEAETEIERRSA